MNNVSKNVCDTPLLSAENDELDISKYTKGLVDFIKHCDTPMTISIQGEWGSGKTSLINKLDNELKNGFHTLRINTWEYALVHQDDIPMVLFNDFITKIAPKGDSGAKEALTDFIKIGTRAVVAKYTEGGLDIKSELLKIPSLGDLKDKIAKLIEEKSNNGSKKLLFFVDDLDRLNPVDAIRILELLKNIFDQPHCIFVLAIDYEIVVKGLKSKFGGDENEREYRQFFDKIVQLPFTMPVSNYSLDAYLESLLVHKINFMDKEAYQSNKETLEYATINTVGKNPRALKRVVNYLSLIKCIIEASSGNKDKKDEDKIVQYYLICIQIAYPQIYSYMTRYPNFVDEWNEDIYSLKMKQLGEGELLFSDKDKLFDDPWEQTLYKYVISLNNKYLTDRLQLISGVLNELIKYIDINMPDGNFDQIMREMIKMSSITDAQNDQIGGGEDSKMEIWKDINKSIKSLDVEFRENNGNSSKIKKITHPLFKYIQVNIKDKDGFDVKVEFGGKNKVGKLWDSFKQILIDFQKGEREVLQKNGNDKVIFFSSLDKEDLALVIEGLVKR